MTEPAPSPSPASTSGAPLDDRRDDPPVPGSVTADGATASEAQREAQETVRSISRLEESN